MDAALAIAKDRREKLKKLMRVIATHLNEYEFDDGEHAPHTPSDFEKLLIDDAINGLLVDKSFIAAFMDWQLIKAEPR